MKWIIVAFSVPALMLLVIATAHVERKREFERLTGIDGRDIGATAPLTMNANEEAELHRLCDDPAPMHRSWCKEVKNFYAKK